MGRSKIGNVYSFYTEILMLEKANDLEKQGYNACIDEILKEV